jgi:hypothetical protein
VSSALARLFWRSGDAKLSRIEGGGWAGRRSAYRKIASANAREHRNKPAEVNVESRVFPALATKG